MLGINAKDKMEGIIAKNKMNGLQIGKMLHALFIWSTWTSLKSKLLKKTAEPVSGPEEVKNWELKPLNETFSKSHISHFAHFAHNLPSPTPKVPRRIK